LTLAVDSKNLGATVFSPDGSRILSMSWETPRPGGTLRIWNAETGQQIATLWTPEDRVRAATVLGDGRIMAISRDGLKGWDGNTGEPLSEIKTRYDYFFACSPDGGRFISPSGPLDDTLRLWDGRTGRDLCPLPGHRDQITVCSFSADGRRAVSGSRDGMLKIWDIERGIELVTLSGHLSAIMTCAFSPDGRRVLSSSFDDTQRLWDSATGSLVATLRGGVSDFVFSPDGHSVASALVDGTTMRLWDVETGHELLQLKGHAAKINACAFSPDGHYLASASDDQTVRAWDARTGKEQGTFSGHASPVRRLAISPAGDRILSGATDEIRLWEFARAFELPEPALPTRGADHSGYIWAWAFSADGSRLITGGADACLKIWDARTGQNTHTLSGHAATVTACAISPGAGTIVSGSDDSSLKIWDGESGREIRTLSGHADRVTACAFSPDCRRIVSASRDRTLKVWLLETGELLTTLHDHLNGPPAQRCAFSADGLRVFSCEYISGDVDVWDALTGCRLTRLNLALPSMNYLPAESSPSQSPSTYAEQSADVMHLWNLGFGRSRTFSIPSPSGPTRVFFEFLYSKDRRRFILTAESSSLFKFGLTANETEATLLRRMPSGLGTSADRVSLLDAGFTMYPTRAWAFSPDDSYVVSAGVDRRLTLWPSDGAVRLAEYWMAYACAKVLWSPTEPLIALASDEGRVQMIWIENFGRRPLAPATSQCVQ
jgi:WD40 repeat protein